MTVSDLVNANPIPGDGQRDLAARLLAFRFGDPKIEFRSSGKKVDVKFEINEFGKTRILFVESKDYAKPLGRQEVVSIYADYSGILERCRPSSLLLITRCGLTADAQTYVDNERFDMAHQTIWALENEVLGLAEYTRHLAKLFDDDGLSQYYLETTAKKVEYDPQDPTRRSALASRENLFPRVEAWLEESAAKPLAVLGGYGAGKSSFAKRVASHFAGRALESTQNPIPILIKLGMFSRFASIDSMIGSMFSSEFPVNQFNIRLFLDCLHRGRFIIICDGFDEMKHAMSWSDFRATVAEINKLDTGASKLILLGRPNAFMSSDEHLQVLQGRRRIGSSYRRLTEWPEFEEWELSDFNHDEQSQFIRRYLAYIVGKSGQQLAAAELEERVEKVAELAATESEIFSKPVHAQILTDLGSDPDFDLSAFGKRVSRWDLYQYFFAHLVERESSKAARRPVSDESRLEFLCEVAFWLFSDKSGKTSFSAVEIPESIIKTIEMDESDDPDIRTREYLTGAFLEKKSGDVFFFGHRSFVEFLVAFRMLKNNPVGREHGLYARLIQGSVRDFLEEGLAGGRLDLWARTFDCSGGLIDLDYVRFLSRHCGNFRNVKSELPKASNAALLFGCFDDSFSFGPVAERRLLRAAADAAHDQFYLCLKMIDISMSKRKIDRHGLDKSILDELARALANKETFVRDSYMVDTIKKEVKVDGDKLRAMVNDACEKMSIEIVDGFDIAVSDGWPKTFSASWDDTYGRVLKGRGWFKSRKK